MSDMTNHPVGLRPEDKARIQRIKTARPDLGSLAAVVREALREMDEREAERTAKSEA